MRSQTMKSVRIQIISLILAGLIAQPANASVIPGRWEKVAALEMASSITVNLKNGDRMRGQLRGLSTSSLELLSPAGRAMIPKANIQTVTISSKDRLGDGAGIGTAIGVGLGLGTVGIAALAGGGLDPATVPGLLLLAGGIGAGVGAGIGVAADAATKSEDIVLYEAPGTPQRSKPEVSEWWPPDLPRSETQPANFSQ